MLDVFFYEAFEEESEQLRRFLPQGVLADFDWRTIQERGDPAPPARIISLRTQSRIPPEWAGALGALLTRSTGYDHLIAYRTLTGAAIPCGYLPLYCARAVAEQALLLWMALLRKLPEQTAHFAAFNRDHITGRECLEKTLAVVGVGNIGYEIARLGRSLGMTVRGVDIVHRHADVEYLGRDDALAMADIVVCAMNLTAQNNGYFAGPALEQIIKPGAIFINIARGEFAPATDLLRALDAGRLAGIGLDVFNQEQELAVWFRANQPVTSPEGQALRELARRPNVILTPHNAFNTVESVERKSRQSMEQIAAFLKNGQFIWPLPE